MLLILILLPLIFALICHVTARRSEAACWYVALLGTALELAAAILASLQPDHSLVPGLALLGPELCLALDGFRRVYILVIAFLWLMTTLFSGEYMAHYKNRGRYYSFQLLTLGLMMGEFLSQSLAQGFVFLCLMTASCSAWMRHEQTPEAHRSADGFVRTTWIGCGAGLVGLILLYILLGTTSLSELPEAAAACENRALLYAAGFLLLVCFGARAGMVPMHNWLTNTHPVPAPGSALVSGVITKSGIWGVLAVSCDLFHGDALWGAVIVVLGLVTMLTGAVLALVSVNLKRTLACSSVSQIGFILVGIGMMGILGEENALAARGVLLHMVNHSLFKLVLYTGAGVVVMNLHRLELNDIRGFGRGKPLLLVGFLMGALGIGGIPGWSGYISKTLLHEAIVEGAVHTGSVWLHAAEWLFLLTGGLTVCYMTKLFVALFVEKHPDRQAEFDAKQPCMNWRSALALLLPAALLPILGLLPGRLMDPIADLGTDFFRSAAPGHTVHYFSLENLKGVLISILIGALVYLLFVRRFCRQDGRYVDPLQKKS